MESLDLPKELYWDLKLEPASPPTTVASELFSLDEPTVATFLYDDNFAHGISIMSDDEAESLQEAVSMELLSGEDLVVEFLDLKDEECLLDQKAPHYIEYETASFPQHLDVVSQALLPITKGQVAEFQHCDASFTLQQLTPPQSPPQFNAYQQQQQQQELVKEEQKVQPYVADVAAAPTAVVAPAYSFTNNWTPVNDNVREAQLVDDIVNMRAKELELPTNWQLYNDDCESQASSSMGSSSSNSDTSVTGSSVADADEEWLPEMSSNSPAHTIEEEQSPSASPSSSSGSAKKRTRTYGRGVEDRKIRKKEQNKNAATRYRQKKKIEMEHVLGEEQELVQANEELRRTLSERRNESRYLRQLIREFYEGRKK
ncbi:activating transcription factor of chaperone isoform X1 [Drosophila albomicans]|uniref:Activating transcription factor of chaperone isoform X1 n=1 Tax=Drosophila albomicans TaxID=7291 RepID=A0A9C6WDK4_DROAB|nr:activating transcription factor of chaperone isoform X1 [Drosophila albomicans]